MIEKIVYGETLPQAYHYALWDLYEFGEISDCETQTKTTTQKELGMTMVVRNPLKEPMISKMFIGGPYDMERYRQEMLYGILDFCIGNGWEYTYHNRMVQFPNYEFDNFYGDVYYKAINQKEFVIEELKRCPYSRKATIIFRAPSDMSTSCSDPACLQHIQYFIRKGKLDCDVLFRSNDACKATFMNAFALILLQKEIADELGVKVGSYTHRANSFHCYEADFGLLDSYFHRIVSNLCSPEELTYHYEGYFKQLMEDEQDRVKELVESMKCKVSL